MNTPQLPARITTKAEALALAAELFPGHTAALERLDPGTTHPRYALNHRAADVLRGVFFWLHESKPKVYARARWHLFYDLALRVIKQTDENGFAKCMDLHRADRAKVHLSLTAANTITGDGAGI